MHDLQQVILRLIEYVPKRRGAPLEALVREMESGSAVLISSARNPYGSFPVSFRLRHRCLLGGESIRHAHVHVQSQPDLKASIMSALGFKLPVSRTEIILAKRDVRKKRSLSI